MCLKSNGKKTEFMKWIKISLCFLPFLCAILWTISPMIKTYVSIYRLPALAYNHKDVEQDAFTQEEIRRKIQAYFRDYDIYLPFDDMVFIPSDITKDEQRTYFENTQKLCGKGSFIFWMQQHIRLPLWGDYVWEDCWQIPFGS
jgi:hypothetical protein